MLLGDLPNFTSFNTFFSPRSILLPTYFEVFFTQNSFKWMIRRKQLEFIDFLSFIGGVLGSLKYHELNGKFKC